MLNKNDPLIGAVQEVMKKNQAERDAVRLVNEKFGVTDRKALPHERQGEWDAAYKTVLTEGVEALDEANFPGAPSVNMPKSMRGGKHTQQYNDLHTKLKSLADSGKIDTPEGRKEAENHIDAIQNLVDKHLPGNPVPSKKIWLGENSFAALAPPYDKATEKDRLVGAGVLEKHPTQPGKHVLAKKPMEEDVTSPSSMGIKKPDYAPAGTTPDYAKPKEQTVNRAAKTSLPPGTMKESVFDKVKKKLEERKVNPHAIGMAQAMKSTGDEPPLEKSTIMKAHEIAKKVEGKVNEGFNSRHSLSVNASVEEQAMTAGAVGLRQQKAANIQAGLAAQRSAAQAGPGQSGSTTVVPAAASAPAAAPAAKPNAPGVDRGRALQAQRQNPTVTGTRFGGASQYQARTAAQAAKPNPLDRGAGGVPGTGNRLVKPVASAAPKAAPKAAPRPTGTSTPVRASTSGGLRTSRDANLLARARAGGGQKLSTTFKSGGDRLAFFTARNRENK